MMTNSMIRLILISNWERQIVACHSYEVAMATSIEVGPLRLHTQAVSHVVPLSSGSFLDERQADTYLRWESMSGPTL
jgi:hypothetical protein